MVASSFDWQGSQKQIPDQDEAGASSTGHCGRPQRSARGSAGVCMPKKIKSKRKKVQKST
jgi:hypothetical protein